jgi:hypothetical protein
MRESKLLVLWIMFVANIRRDTIVKIYNELRVHGVSSDPF